MQQKKQGTCIQWAAVGIAMLLLLGMGGVLVVLLQQMMVGASPAAESVAAQSEAPTEATDDTPAAETPAEPENVLFPAPTVAPTATSAPLPVYEPRFESAPCPMDTPEDVTVDCGYLVVPEDRRVADGPTMRLAVAIMRSSAPQPDPILYLEGGPGGSALLSVNMWANIGFVQQRDVILFDQRGTGFSEPSLNCPEVEDWSQRYMSTMEGFVRNQMLRCHRRLVDEDINLRVYNSSNNAADVNDLRQALGYEQINLLGISYGTKLALTVMRDYPEHIRSVVLDSTYPLYVDGYAEQAENTIRAIDALLDGCAADADCNAAYPNLKAEFYAMVERLNESPVGLRFTDFSSGQEQIIGVSGNDLTGLVFLSLYDTWTIPELPRILYEASQERYQPLKDLVTVALSQGYRGFGDSFSEGMFYSVQCHEELPFADYEFILTTRDTYPQFGDYFIDSFKMDRSLCDLWRVDEAASIENEPVYSDIPTMVLAGSYDPITPPHWGWQVAEHLTTGYYYEFNGYGHGVSIVDDCTRGITQTFFANPAVAPDASCVTAINGSGPDFRLP